jgi:hypothetical protein
MISSCVFSIICAAKISIVTPNLVPIQIQNSSQYVLVIANFAKVLAGSEPNSP